MNIEYDSYLNCKDYPSFEPLVFEAFVDECSGNFPEYEISFKILDDNGKLIIIEQIKDVLEKEELENANSNQVEKDNSIKELKKLKDLFDSGILTKEEYDNAAAPHKKIVLGL